MKTIKNLLLIVVLLISSSLYAQQTKKPMIAGYLHSGSIKPGDDLEFINHVDRLYFFGLTPDENGRFVVSDHYLWALDTVQSLIRDEQEFLLVVGGGKQVANMHEMGNNSKKRTAFAKKLVKFAKQYKFDGIDMDWETYWRAKPEPLHVPTENLIDLLSQIKEQMPEGSILTAALGRHSTQQAKDIMHLVDDVSIMIYSSLNDEGLHAPLYTVHEAMQGFKKVGVPNEKLLIGVPFYAIRGKNRPKKQTMVYRKIVDLIPEDRTDIGVIDGYSFNCVDAMKDKRKYAIENGYKGIMIWELTQDAHYSNPRSLLRALNGE